MEKRLEFKVIQFQNAVENFNTSLELDTEGFSEVLLDTVKSGIVQKFEVCSELLWKTLKIYLYEINGIDCKSPKSVIKEFYNQEYINSDSYQGLITILNDRNSLSYIYNREQFEVIYSRVVSSITLFFEVINIVCS